MTTPDPHETVREFLYMHLGGLDLDLDYYDYLTGAYPEMSDETLEQMSDEGWPILIAELARVAKEFEK